MFGSKTTGARVAITYQDDTEKHAVTQTAEIVHGYGGVTFSIAVEQITTAPQITEMKDGSTLDFGASPSN